MSQMSRYQEIYFNSQLHKQHACYWFQVLVTSTSTRLSITLTPGNEWKVLAHSDFAGTGTYTGVWYFVLLPGYCYEVLIPGKGTWRHEAALVSPALLVFEPVARWPRYASSWQACTFAHLDILIFAYFDICTFAFLDIWTFGHLDTFLQAKGRLQRKGPFSRPCRRRWYSKVY